MDLELKNYKNRHSLSDKVRRVAWAVAWTFLCWWTPARFSLFIAWRRLILRVFGAKIGKGCWIWPHIRVRAPWNLEMGAYSTLSNGVNCYTVDRIVIGHDATISEDVFLCTASHDISSPIMELTYRPIYVEDNVWVASRAIVLPGVTLGEGSVVGAGAVVTKDVVPWTVVGGNPAREIGKREIRK